MLYNLKWLEPGQMFPPQQEEERLVRYKQNMMLFDGEHFGDPAFRQRNNIQVNPIEVYKRCASRISKVVGNFEDVVSFPTLLNYQRLMSLKMADLVCGEYPTISGSTAEENETIGDARDASDFDAKLYSTVLDMSRYGDAIWRMYRDYDGRNNFTCWDPAQWFPIVAQDGTYTIKQHCLCWLENLSEDVNKPDWHLHVQIHETEPRLASTYEERDYKISDEGIIQKLVATKSITTGLKTCSVVHLKAFTVTGSVYGYDDYVPLDSLLAEIMARIGQISRILDKHADPSITGPASMLKLDQKTGEYYLETGSFYAVNEGEDQPKYMTWDGQLSSAFKELELLLNQMYILSEMGAAVLGGQDGSSQAISGTAMRFKMVNPLAKARRISNALTRPVRMLLSSLCATSTDIPYKNISVFWADGLPDDPRENIENCKLATGEVKMMPLKTAIREFFKRTDAEAQTWIDELAKAAQLEAQQDPNRPGPQDGTGVNPQKKGSETGLTNFHSSTNGEV